MKIASRGIKGGNNQRATGCLTCPIQERKITDTEATGIFDLEENNVDIIDKNLLPWEEVEKALKEAEAPEGPEYQEEAYVAIQEEDSMPLPEIRKQSRGYPKT